MSDKFPQGKIQVHIDRTCYTGCVPFLVTTLETAEIRHDDYCRFYYLYENRLRLFTRATMIGVANQFRCISNVRCHLPRKLLLLGKTEKKRKKKQHTHSNANGYHGGMISRHLACRRTQIEKRAWTVWLFALQFGNFTLCVLGDRIRSRIVEQRHRRLQAIISRWFEFSRDPIWTRKLEIKMRRSTSKPRMNGSVARSAPACAFVRVNESHKIANGLYWATTTLTYFIQPILSQYLTNLK